nr:zinc carboxypeptidase-like [Danaus plexippus plexippus]
MSKSDIIEYFLHFLSSTMKTNVFAIFFILIINLKICQSANYTDYSLYNVVPVERYQLDFLQNLEKQQYLNAIFWTRPFRMFRDIQILVPREHLNVFKERLGHFHLNATITTSNIEQLFQQQKFKRYTRMKFESFSWNSYYDLESVYQWMTDIATKNSDRVKLKAIGKSAEGREILTLEIVTENPKGKVIVEGAIHGNEWLTTQFVTYLAFFLVYPEKSFNWRLKQVAKKYTWILIPVVNPDGYDYSMKVDRLWRKNRRKTSNATIGVDLNKNFKYRFCEYGGSKDVSSAYYCGPQAFSEPETLAMSKFIHFNRHQLNFYFAFHAYGQKIIIPYSDRVQHIENFAEMENYGKQAILKMYKLYGIKYGIGTIYDVYGYKSSGDSISWVKKTYGVKYSLSFYLRDNGTYGYALPPDNILPACKETLTGLMELMTVRHRSVERELFSSTSNFRSKFYIVSIFITILLY